MANDVSTRLKAVRLMHGLSQRELAEFFTMDPAATPQVFYSGKELVELGADTGSEMLTHAGEEGGVVVSGRIEVTVGGQTQVLGPGDAYYFSSAMPHRFRNRGRERCEIISAATPPTL